VEIFALSPFALEPIALGPSALTADYGQSVEADPNVTLHLSRTLADVTLTSAANVVAHVVGTLSQTLASVTLTSAADVQTPVGETIRFAMPAATYSTTVADFRTGTSGSNYFGAFIAIPSGSIGNHAWYFTHNGFGWNPQAYNAALSGYTMHAIDLAAGGRTAAQVATAVRSAIDGTALYAAAGGSSANVEITDDIDADGCFTGSSSPGAAGAFGCREDVPVFDGNPIGVGLQAFASFTAGPALVTGLATRLNSAGDPVRLCLYTGGTAASGGGGVVNPTPDWDDTVLFCEAATTGSGTGWVCQALVPGEVDVLADNTAVQYVLKGETSSTHGSFTTMGSVSDSDLGQQQLSTIDTGDMDPDPSLTFPASLEGFSLAGSFSVVLMIAFEYRVAPQRGDAGGITLTVL